MAFLSRIATLQYQVTTQARENSQGPDQVSLIARKNGRCDSYDAEHRGKYN
jgi:hypothetical protein